MTSIDNTSGANIVSGSTVVENPFIISASGNLDVYAKTDEGVKIYIPASDVAITGSEAKVRWAEKRD